MARAHPVSAIIVQLPREEGMVIRLGHPPCPRLALELLPNPVPRLPVDDRRMKAVVALPFVAQPPDIDRVLSPGFCSVPSSEIWFWSSITHLYNRTKLNV